MRVRIISIYQFKKGFTLAELLIALTILAVIATFTIPKLLMSQQDARSNAVAREDLGAVNSAYYNYSLTNTVNVNTFTMELLQPFLNYTQQVPTAEGFSVDTYTLNTGSAHCNNASYTCLRMHNGSVLFWPSNTTFTSQGCDGVGLRVYVDPDGAANATTVTDGPGKSVLFCLHSNGRTGMQGPPSWFSL